MRRLAVTQLIFFLKVAQINRGDILDEKEMFSYQTTRNKCIGTDELLRHTETEVINVLRI